MTYAINWLYRYRAVPWFITGLIALAWFLPDFYDPVRFKLRPVVSMNGELQARTTDGVLIRIYGEKLRGVECKYLDIQAFGDRIIGMPIDLHIKRVDMPSDGKTKPAGSYDIGTWNVHPTATVSVVRVYVSHDCEGSKVATQIAKVML